MTSCIDVVLPVITKIINLSLESGMFTGDWKCALINPLLKKDNLDLLFNNYRPISNLQFVSKLTERAVFNQMHDYIVMNVLYPVLQSSYRKRHSTETALLKVLNDILVKMNSQHVTLLVMLDAVDHRILLNRLLDEIGICGNTLRLTGLNLIYLIEASVFP